MKRILPLLLLLLLLINPAFARKVKQAEAQQIAAAFLQSTRQGDVKTRFQAMPPKFKAATTTSDEYAPFYVYNVEGDKGFVIVSGDDAVANIFGYADKGSFDLENAPANVVAMMKLYAHLVDVAGDGAKVNGRQSAMSKGTPVIAPLLGSIEWNQNAPYNSKCPTYQNKQGQTVNYYVGCVATAMAQIMRFYSYPTKGKGTKSYISNVGKLEADFGNTTYAWDRMPARMYPDNANTAQNNAVGTLCFHLGVSVDMSYEEDGSGAYSQMVTGALIKYFNYDKGAAFKQRNNFSSAEWMKMIKDELNAHRPIYYSASNEDGGGGHAFVCDGYDTNDYLHINWGWGGQSNGYFMVNALNPDELGIGANGGGYNIGQEMVIGIQPPTGTQKEKEWPIYGASSLGTYSYGGSYTITTYFANHDSEPFRGTAAAVLVKDDNVVKVLQTKSLNISGADPTTNYVVGGEYVTMSSISKNVTEVPDGDYRLCFAFKENGVSNWTILRFSKTMNSFMDAKVESGVITATLHKPVPDAELMEKITTLGDMHAKGSGHFVLKLKNNSPDFYLQRIALRFTMTDGSNRSFVLNEPTKVKHLVYDKAEKTVELIADLPLTMKPGKYEVTAFEEKYANHPFKDAPDGKTILEVKEEATHPIIRQAAQYYWLNYNTYTQDIKQGDYLYGVQSVRNYGTTGRTKVLTKLVKTNDESKNYNIFIFEKYLGRQELVEKAFAKKLCVDPGEYRMETYYLVDNKWEKAERNVEDCIIDVQPNPDLALSCESFELPAQMEKGKTASGKVTVKALKDVQRSFVIYLQNDLTNEGEVIFSKAVLTLSAGETATFNFNYTPTIDNGEYLLYMNTKINAKMSEPAGNYDNYYKVVTIGNTTGIETTVNHAADVDITFSPDGRTLTIKTSDDSNNVNGIEIFSLDGQRVMTSKAIAETMSLPLANGTYILRVTTNKGVATRKFMIR